MPQYYGTDNADIIDQQALGLEPWTQVVAKDGDDIIIVTAASVYGQKGHDRISGDPGSVVSYGDSPGGIIANLQTGEVHDGWGTIDLVVGIRGIDGSQFDDTITGTSLDDGFTPLNGNDAIDGGDGIDEITLFGNLSDFNVTYADGAVVLEPKTSTPFTSMNGGKKTVKNVERFAFAGDEKITYIREQLTPQMFNTEIYRYTPGVFPDLSAAYTSEYWSTTDAINAHIGKVELNGDDRTDFLIHLWQRAPQRPPEYATRNAIITIESRPDGSYVDTTSMRFGQQGLIHLGYERGGFGLQTYGDINHDGQVDIVFALNRDDGRNFGDTAEPGESYLTALISQPEGEYRIEKISPTPLWSYMAQLIDVDGHYELWNMSAANINSIDLIYGDLFTNGQQSYRYDSFASTWHASEFAPAAATFNIPKSFVAEGRIQQAFAMVWDSSATLNTNPGDGLAYRLPIPGLFKWNPSQGWELASTVAPGTASAGEYFLPYSDGSFRKTPALIMDNNGEISVFATREFQAGDFEMFPGSGPVVMATRSYFPLVWSESLGGYVADGLGVAPVKMEFFIAHDDQISIAPISIENENVYVQGIYQYLDFNRDGLTDLVSLGWKTPLTNANSGAPTVYLNTGFGHFIRLPESIFNQIPTFGAYTSSQIVDTNGDGGFDVILYPQILGLPDSWELGIPYYVFLGPATLPTDLYVDDIKALDRIGSPLISLQGGDDLLLDINQANGITTILGGAGTDTAKYSGAASAYEFFTRDAGQISIRNLESRALDNLHDFERIQFADKSLAFDFDKTQPAGKSALLLGALAPIFISNANVFGAILAEFDKGNSLEQVAQLFIDLDIIAMLAGGNSNSSIAILAFKNIVGVAPNSDQLDLLLSFMDGRLASLGQAQFLAAVTQLDLNAARVDLIGLDQHGLEYTALQFE